MTTRGQQPGLHTRLGIERLRISSQHQRLGFLFDAVAGSLEAGDHDQLHGAFHAFADGLRAHFEVEERVQIPALHGAQPTLEKQLQSLVREHSDFRERLALITRALAEGRIDQAGSELQALSLALKEHEATEESLFARG
jgi:hypothetical protein